MGQKAKQIAQIAEGPIGQFATNTTTNPKKHCNKITTESDNKIKEGDGEMVKVEEEKGENRKEGEKYEVVESGVSKELSHSFMPIKEEKKGFFFSDKLLPKNYFAGWSEKNNYLIELKGRCVALKKRI